MNITARQVEVLGGVTWRDFLRRLAQHVEALHDRDSDASPPSSLEVAAFAERTAERALEFGLVTEQQVALYATCAHFLGEDFEKQDPIAARVLSSPLNAPEVKIEWLVRHAGRHLEQDERG